MQPQVFALMIGIDQYKTLPDLKGCVNDANDLKNFLTQLLRVPELHIKLITNQNATRANILSTFQTHLIYNTAIRGGDTIIIFYAGHGSRVATPNSRYNTSGMVETICPHDERCIGKMGEYIHGIPDYTVHTLLQKLAAAKGNNVTAIFDCCHSGGIGRNTHAYRFVESIVPIPDDLDSDLIGRAATTSLPQGFWFKFMESHVLLAACRDNQIAVETTFGNLNVWRGRFSESLVRTLRTISFDRTTYIDLMKIIDREALVWLDQNPLVEGKNKDRFLFNGWFPSVSKKALPLTQTSILPRSYEIKMGSAEGVVEGTEFLITDTRNNDICFLSAGSVELDRSFLVAKDKNENLPEIPIGSTATVWDWKNEGMTLKIYLAHDSPSITAILFPGRHLVTSELSSLPTPRKFQQANSWDSDIELQQRSDGEFGLKWLRGMIKNWAPTARSRFSLQPYRYHRLPVILDAIAHFNYFLKCQGDAPIPNVTLEMHAVTGRFPNQEPSADIFRNKEAEVKTAGRYGFTICNGSHLDLFPYLFYFDPYDYSIQAWYTPSTSVSLPAMHAGRATRLPIGYGSGSNGYALKFHLPEGEKMDTGFVKLFVSTKYLDMGWIKQRSPFDPGFEGSGRLPGGWETIVQAQVWNALLGVLTMQI